MLDPIYASPERLALFETRVKEKRAKVIARASDPERNELVAKRVMAAVDSLPEGWRLLVHDYGLFRVRKLYERRMTLANAELQLLAESLDL